MFLKKAICCFFIAAGIFAAAFAFSTLGHEDHAIIQADGGSPTPPPIPWGAPVQGPALVADGGSPTPPPIPWVPAGNSVA